jgi:hypothetical protein
MFLLLTLFASVIGGLTVTRLQNVTLYFEVTGKITLSPGECGYPDPTLPMLQCNITREGPYLQVKGATPGVAFSPSSTDLSSSGGYQYIGPMAVEIGVNRFEDVYTFGVSGIIPPIDNSTLQIEFNLGSVFG